MVQRYNGDLANDWGNLCSRALNMAEKYFDSVVPADSATDLSDGERSLRAIAGLLPERYESAMAALNYAAALEATWDLIKETNRYIESAEPWNLAKSEEHADRLKTVIYHALEAVRIAALFCAPILPITSADIWSRLGLGDIHEVKEIEAQAKWGGLPSGNRIVKGTPLFPRIYDE